MSTPLPINLSDKAMESLVLISQKKGLTPEQAAALIVQFGCRMLEDGSLNDEATLMDDLDLCRDLRRKMEARLDELLPLAEKALLDAVGLQRSMRNKVFSEASR